MVLLRLWLLGIATSIKYASLMGLKIIIIIIIIIINWIRGITVRIATRWRAGRMEMAS